MARAKAKALARVPQSREDAVWTVGRIGTLRREIAARKASADEQLKTIGEQVEQAMAPLSEELTMDVKNLQRLVARIDELIPEEQAENGLFMTYEEFKVHQRKLDAVVQQLVEEETAKRGHSSGADTLTMAGVRTSSTGASIGLLRNWQNAARRKIVEAKDACGGHVASDDDPKVCGRCGIHIDELRPDDDGDPINLAGSGPVPIEPREG